MTRRDAERRRARMRVWLLVLPAAILAVVLMTEARRWGWVGTDPPPPLRSLSPTSPVPLR
jgi:hypothetical protein